MAGVARNSREEQIAARDKHRRMAELYRQHVLKEAPGPQVIPIGNLKSRI